MVLMQLSALFSTIRCAAFWRRGVWDRALNPTFHSERIDKTESPQAAEATMRI